MDRRAFFKTTLDKSSRAIVDEASRHVNKHAARWIRPPFASDELDFLLACTRCGDCGSACGYDVIFDLPARLGASVAGTPALDLLNRGCHLCADWPCVSICKTGALVLDTMATDGVETAPPTARLPRLALARVDPDTCLPFQGPECGACVPACPVPGALALVLNRPEINQTLCTGCGLCRESCIVEPGAIQIKSLYTIRADA